MNALSPANPEVAELVAELTREVPDFPEPGVQFKDLTPLLADRRGVIDLDLPISGSLNDPQFRIGPVIGKVILNLIGKALTSPFSLLASAFGGGEEMSSVAFAPGSATLSPEAQQNVGKVAKALVDRPALKLTVTGTANLEAEREGLQRERLLDNRNGAVHPGAKAALVKGGHASGDVVTDIVFTQDAEHIFTAPRIDTRHTHGTGCAMARSLFWCGGMQDRLVNGTTKHVRINGVGERTIMRRELLGIAGGLNGAHREPRCRLRHECRRGDPSSRARPRPVPVQPTERG